MFRQLLPAALLAVTMPLHADGGSPFANETKEARDIRMGWWREAKFGMFIHWGIYAVPAGTYKEQKIKNLGEWIMLNGKIPVADYQAYARQFNPVKYRPEEWAKLAKEVGMRYMVITSKHHDGFTLFPSAASKWNIVDATPYGKDLIGPLADAARKEGLKFGLYYSQAQDWTNPGGAKSTMNDGDGWDEAHKGSFDQYIDTVCVPQVKEILTAYRPDVLWWDTPHLMTNERANKLAPLLALQPGIIHNDRLGGDYSGDTNTPEQHIPATGYPGRDWETCMTMNDTWGFKSYDHNWKSVNVLLTNLVDIVSKGGNYLLNVGPTAEGEIPKESIERLQEVGKWMKKNGTAIYGTTASPFKKLPWGRCSVKTTGTQTTLYLHVFDWPQDGKLLVPGLSNPCLSAALLDGGAQVSIAQVEDGVALTVPATAPDPIVSVIALTIEGAPQVVNAMLQPAPDGSLTLDGTTTTTTTGDLKYEDDNNCLGFWVNPEDSAVWDVKLPAAGKWQVSAEVAADAASAIRLQAANGSATAKVPATGGYATFVPVELGTLELASGAQQLTLKSDTPAWQPVNVRKITLRPAH